MTCLIVDDSPGFLAAAARLLQRQGMTVVDAVSTGDEALRLVQEHRPDVVLVDIDLGAESGLDVAWRLHERATSASTRIILISMHGEDDYRDLIDASPAIGFLPKAKLSAGAVDELLGDATTGSRET